MREIKFRAWDDVSKVMSFSNFEQFDGMMGFRFSHFETEKPVYMQCTGLHDKNDKEIYEGDIFKDWKGRMLVVVWRGFYWRFELPEKLRKELRYRYEGFHSAGEVIGNIYEHPHLLNQE
ncbi:hypothetical protein EEL31_21460 [Brevibacillus laterosporus]|uniref:YopX protein domain-containing protein n=1 Tax=Brevibacillus laterosporus TaxID=1465 RepID=A0A518V618_BRELA|nr:YopX family protein [Brevibacillus laterosporus]QDX92457.1 hypothetical protein EEL30_09035 [Brevibacillus laterosporus]TPG70759.1 hypothetical protein EEL31_21460 [Brevibacillus laterosporus]